MSAKTATSKTPKTNPIPFENLRQWNMWLAALYVVQAAAILIVSIVQQYPVTTNFLGLDTFMSQAKGHQVFAGGMHHLFDVNMAWLVAAFLLFAAVAHGLAATKLRSTYEKDLKNGINKIRWIEYAFSASVMLVVMALLGGVYDAASLLMIIALTAAANLLWLTSEAQHQKAHQSGWFHFIFGCATGIVPWVVLAVYLLSSHLYGSGMPAFVAWVYLSLFILFAAAGANLYLWLHKSRSWTNYVFVERIYMIISLVAKTALAWQVFAGILHP